MIHTSIHIFITYHYSSRLPLILQKKYYFTDIVNDELKQ